jgi:phenylacetate-CoA ligase
MVSLFERYLQAAGYDLQRAMGEISEISRFAAPQLESWQRLRKQQIARFHFSHNSLYRKKTGGSFPERWDQLPVIEKSDLQGSLDSMITNGMRLENVYRANTSGSSGHPFWFVKDKYAHACSWALIGQRYGWHGITFSSKQARFCGIPLEYWPHLKESAKDRLMNRVRFPVFDLSDAVLKRYARRFQQTSFDYIYGYTNSLVLFARYLLRKGVTLKRLCPSLKICITTSEVCTPEDLDILSNAFDVRVVNEYGASEVGVIAFERPDGQWILSDETLYVEVVDRHAVPVPEGEPGDLLITDLRNRALPFIRYRIGDVGVLERDARTGRRRLVRLEGRESDTIVLPSGRRSPGLTFYYISRGILESSGALREFIVRQTAPDEFGFDIVSERPLSSSEEAQLRRKVDEYLEPGLKLRINRVPRIERPASGKIKHFYSELEVGRLAAGAARH